MASVKVAARGEFPEEIPRKMRQRGSVAPRPICCGRPSAAGSFPLPADDWVAPPRFYQAGFGLIEVRVGLIVMALLFGLARFTLGDHGQRVAGIGIIGVDLRAAANRRWRGHNRREPSAYRPLLGSHRAAGQQNPYGAVYRRKSRVQLQGLLIGLDGVVQFAQRFIGQHQVGPMGSLVGYDVDGVLAGVLGIGQPLGAETDDAQIAEDASAYRGLTLTAIRSSLSASSYCACLA